MKKYSSIIHILSLACAGLIFAGCTTNQGWSGDRASASEFRAFARFSGPKFWDLISSLSCQSMART